MRIRSLHIARDLATVAREIPQKQPFKVVEVGARDGLQNEKKIISTENKVAFINRLSECGLKSVEATSFVSPKWIPQMADHRDVIEKIKKFPGVSYPVLVPNLTGLENVRRGRVRSVSPKMTTLQTCKLIDFTRDGRFSDIDTQHYGACGVSKQGPVYYFNVGNARASILFELENPLYRCWAALQRKNVNANVNDSLIKLVEVTKTAVKEGLKVRGYVSCVIGCPYEGRTDSNVVARVTDALLDAGCYEVSLGDTIGVGSAGSVTDMLNTVLKTVPVEKLAVHFHDTYGQALANVVVAIEKGIRVADSSIAGLGGCPYAKGASGNIATEDLVYMLHDMGFDTGVDMEKLIETSTWICSIMGRSNASRVAVAFLAKRAME